MKEHNHGPSGSEVSRREMFGILGIALGSAGLAACSPENKTVSGDKKSNSHNSPEAENSPTAEKTPKKLPIETDPTAFHDLITSPDFTQTYDVLDFVNMCGSYGTGEYATCDIGLEFRDRQIGGMTIVETAKAYYEPGADVNGTGHYSGPGAALDPNREILGESAFPRRVGSGAFAFAMKTYMDTLQAKHPDKEYKSGQFWNAFYQSLHEEPDYDQFWGQQGASNDAEIQALQITAMGQALNMLTEFKIGIETNAFDNQLSKEQQQQVYRFLTDVLSDSDETATELRGIIESLVKNPGTKPGEDYNKTAEFWTAPAINIQPEENYPIIARGNPGSDYLYHHYAYASGSKGICYEMPDTRKDSDTNGGFAVHLNTGRVMPTFANIYKPAIEK